MKKALTFALIILVISTTLPINAQYEPKAYDSVIIDTHETRALYRADPSITQNDIIIKRYIPEDDYPYPNHPELLPKYEGKLGPFMRYCASHETFDIQEMMSKLLTKNHLLIIQEDGTVYINHGAPSYAYHVQYQYGIPPDNISEPELDFIKYAIDTQSVFDPSVIITNIYVIYERESGNYVYYETSIGDFILTRAWVSNTNNHICLFPIEYFLSINKTVYEQRKKCFLEEDGELLSALSIGIGNTIAEDDLRPYFFEPISPADNVTDTAPAEPEGQGLSPWVWVAIVSGAALVIAVPTAAVVISKSKKKNS